MKQRCEWAGIDPLYTQYHDREWGVPQHDDRKLFELLILEGTQAGLSWVTILRKRETYRKAFDGFDAEKIAEYGDAKTAQLLLDPGIVRNRLKIAATIQNARAFLAVREGFGSFDGYLWSFVRGAAEEERLEDAGRDACKVRGVGSDEQGAQEARVQVRGPDDLLRLHAGGRDGERPRGGLLSVRRSGVTGQALRVRCPAQ